MFCCVSLCFNIQSQVEAKVGETYFMFIKSQKEPGDTSADENTVFVPDKVNLQTPILTDTQQHRDQLEEFLHGDRCSLPDMLSTSPEPISTATAETDKKPRTNPMKETKGEGKNINVNGSSKPQEIPSLKTKPDDLGQPISTIPRSFATKEAKVRLGRGPHVYPTATFESKTTSGALTGFRTTSFFYIVIAMSACLQLYLFPFNLSSLHICTHILYL